MSIDEALRRTHETGWLKSLSVAAAVMAVLLTLFGWLAWLSFQFGTESERVNVIDLRSTQNSIQISGLTTAQNEQKVDLAQRLQKLEDQSATMGDQLKYLVTRERRRADDGGE